MKSARELPPMDVLRRYCRRKRLREDSWNLELDRDDRGVVEEPRGPNAKSDLVLPDAPNIDTLADAAKVGRALRTISGQVNMAVGIRSIVCRGDPNVLSLSTHAIASSPLVGLGWQSGCKPLPFPKVSQSFRDPEPERRSFAARATWMIPPPPGPTSNLS